MSLKKIILKIKGIALMELIVSMVVMSIGMVSLLAGISAIVQNGSQPIVELMQIYAAESYLRDTTVSSVGAINNSTFAWTNLTITSADETSTYPSSCPNGKWIHVVARPATATSGGVFFDACTIVSGAGT